METEKSNSHRIVLEFGDGIYATRLIHPEGGCEPVSICAACGRSVEDTGQARCDSCPTALAECWVQGWFDETMIDEILHGRIEITVDPEWDYDSETCRLNVVGADMPGSEAIR